MGAAPAHGIKEYYSSRAEPVEIGGNERPAELSNGADTRHEMTNEIGTESRHK